MNVLIGSGYMHYTMAYSCPLLICLSPVTLRYREPTSGRCPGLRRRGLQRYPPLCLHPGHGTQRHLDKVLQSKPLLLLFSFKQPFIPLSPPLLRSSVTILLLHPSVGQVMEAGGGGGWGCGELQVLGSGGEAGETGGEENGAGHRSR